MDNTSQLPRIKLALLIDNDEVDNYITHRILKSISFAERIEIKLSATDALDYLKNRIEKSECLPEVIFLDISMPDMDGFQFLDTFTKIGKQAAVNPRIIVLTNSEYFDLPKMRIMGTPSMIHAVMKKPLSVEALQNLYSKYISE
jgi:CheY-like chemotaxis protein